MRTRQQRRTAAAATGLAALALFAAACSGTSGGVKESDSQDVSGEGKKADQALEHRKCLREQGLKVPEPKSGEDGHGMTIDGGSLSKEKMDKAFKVCASKGGGAGAGKEMSQADKDKAVKFAQCMRKNGFDMPDPKFDGGMAQAMPALKGEDMAKFEKANKACESVGR